VTDPWRDPTAVGAIYVDPTAPVFIAPIVLPEPDPVYSDDALFASASANWRPTPIPVPPIPVLDESGELILVPAAAPTPAMLRDQAVAALKAPPAHYQAPASRGGARSTYTAQPPPPSRPSRRPTPGRPAGSVTTSPSMYLPDTRTTPTAAWQPQPEVPTWLPQALSTQPPQTQPGPAPQAPRQPAGGQARAQQARAQEARTQQPGARTYDPGAVTYRASGRTPGQTRPRGRRRGSKGWIPGVIVLAFVILANVVPHLNGIFHRGAPSGVDQAVNSYYADLEHGDSADAGQLICSARRADWQSSGPSSDLNLRPTAHTITSTKSADQHSWDVAVDIVAPGRQNARITVVHEDGAYRLCGGTGP
jgi:hypothetical protein